MIFFRIIKTEVSKKTFLLTMKERKKKDSVVCVNQILNILDWCSND